VRRPWRRNSRAPARRRSLDMPIHGCRRRQRCLLRAGVIPGNSLAGRGAGPRRSALWVAANDI